MFVKHAENNSSGRYGTPGTARGHDGAGAVLCRIVIPAVLFTLSAFATRFWWRAWLIGPGLRPDWMPSEDVHMADATAGAEAATAAGIAADAGDDGTGVATAAAVKPADEYLICTEWVGPNYQLFAVFGLLFATAWQTQNMRVGTGVAAFFYIGSALYGSLVWRAGLRKVPLYWQEAVMGVLFLVLWAISYPAQAGGAQNSAQALSVQDYFPFIVNSVLGALSLVGGHWGVLGALSLARGALGCRVPMVLWVDYG